MNSVRYRKAESSDYAKINDFYNRYYRINRNMEQFRWEFLDCPAGPAIYTMALDPDDKIIAIQAGIPIEFILSSGEEFLSIKSEDSLMDLDECSKYRKKDIFRELYLYFIDLCKQRDVRLIWGFTHAINTLKRIGFEIPFHSSQYVLVINPLPAYRLLSGLNSRNTRKDKIKIGLLSAGSFINGFQRFFTRKSGLTITEEPLSNIELFHSMTSKGEKMAFIKQDQSFLTWRTKHNPFPISYKVYNFFDNTVRVAQVITSKTEGGMAFIEQMVFDRLLSETVKRGMIRETIALLQKEGANVIRFMAFRSNSYHRDENTLLHKSGFLFINKGIGFMFMNISGPDMPVQPEDIFLSRLYTQGQG